MDGTDSRTRPRPRRLRTLKYLALGTGGLVLALFVFLAVISGYDQFRTIPPPPGPRVQAPGGPDGENILE